MVSFNIGTSLQVLSRLAPFERGIYEDYVANFWCTSSVLVKWKKLYTTQSLRIFSLAATLLTCLPSMVQQVLDPSSKGFLYGLLNSSFSFYLFSFQGTYFLSVFILLALLFPNSSQHHYFVVEIYSAREVYSTPTAAS